MGIVPSDNDMIYRALQKEYKLELKKIEEEEFEKMKQRVEDRMKDAVDNVALRIAKHYTFERMGSELVIRVIKLDDKP